MSVECVAFRTRITAAVRSHGVHLLFHGFIFPDFGERSAEKNAAVFPKKTAARKTKPGRRSLEKEPQSDFGARKNPPVFSVFGVFFVKSTLITVHNALIP
ncbi:MAG TPA: hypothetical protein IAB32_00175 [Candidatus Scatosoma pullicola]|nr:hypothetical protein [Candidatus Scatosoma pullicola]